MTPIRRPGGGIRSVSGAGIPRSPRMAQALGVIGAAAQAFDWLDRASSERNPGLIVLGLEAPLHDLLAYPRVARIVREMELPAP